MNLHKIINGNKKKEKERFILNSAFLQQLFITNDK